MREVYRDQLYSNCSDVNTNPDNTLFPAAGCSIFCEFISQISTQPIKRKGWTPHPNKVVSYIPKPLYAFLRGILIVQQILNIISN